ncbi:glycosyl hydrolase family 26 [Streptomyces sp. XM4193]|uniref:glycoside hydrolase family 26 protein n=1 Tax=Streptomyces sp. XM4193 TaxID=2929782 RepID=UPI001FF93B9C|nr:glycosyl hydrolase [Streptomyces sp. XM4193]MCK1797969.1 glycosyl hydrolase family 26 [Streptomyces sp. XM4193]
MTQRRRWLTGGCAVVAAAGLLFAGPYDLDRDRDGLGETRSDAAPPPNTANPPGGPAVAPGGPRTGGGQQLSGAVGAFLASGPETIPRIGAMERWLGDSGLRVGHTYLPGDLWSNIEGTPGLLEGWARWRQEKQDRLFVLNVPMLERNEENVPDHEVRALLRAGADGRFDRHFEKLARHLVDLGVPDTIVVLGWEMNGTTYTHRCGPDPEAWKAYWKRIVGTMRAVEGQDFRFDFAPNRGTDDIPWTKCYPGDDVVDIIGMDSYDQPPGEDFDDHVDQPYGLRHQVEFAAARGKPISYPEWGLFRNGDNEEYMRRMLDWMKQHRPLYQTISDYCPHGVWQCSENPRSAAIFRKEIAERLVEDAGREAGGRPEPSASGAARCPTLPLHEWAGRGDEQGCARPELPAESPGAGRRDASD